MKLLNVARKVHGTRRLADGTKKAWVVLECGARGRAKVWRSTYVRMYVHTVRVNLTEEQQPHTRHIPWQTGGGVLFTRLLFRHESNDHSLPATRQPRPSRWGKEHSSLLSASFANFRIPLSACSPAIWKVTSGSNADKF